LFFGMSTSPQEINNDPNEGLNDEMNYENNDENNDENNENNDENNENNDENDENNNNKKNLNSENDEQHLMNDNKLSIHDISKYQLPLQNRWTLWHTAPSSEVGGWSDNYKKICNFETVGTFWRLFNNIAPPSMLQIGSSYHLFKGRIKPEWEDSYNSGGGFWTYRFSNDDTKEYWNYAWYHTLLNMIGNNFTHYDHISGLVISIRKAGRGKLELWFRDAQDETVVISIGEQFKQFLSLSQKNILTFVSFQDARNNTKKSERKL